MKTIDVYNSAERKLLSYPQKLSDFLQKKPISPIALEIHPSERCNHRCPECQGKFAYDAYENVASLGEFLDFKLLDKIFGKKKYHPKGVIISGNTGEPLLHPDISYLFKKLKKLKIPFVLITNGGLVSKKNASLIAKSCEGIRISLDAYDKASFLQTHGSHEWDRTLENIELLTSVKKRKKIGIGYLTNWETKRGMAKATRLAKSLKVDYIHFRPFHFQFYNIEKELKECLTYADRNFKVFYPVYKYKINEKTYKKCHAAWFYSVLDSNGNFYICCHHIGRKEALIGNLRDLNWSGFIKAKKKVIDSFTLDSCVPNCRLHLHNTFLDSLREVPLNCKLTEHAPFL